MKKLLYSIIILGALSLTITSCEKGFLDINDNPYVTTDADIGKLMTFSQYRMGVTWSESGQMGSMLQTFVHHVVTKEVGNYGVSAATIPAGRTWRDAYTYVLNNAKLVLEMAEEMEYTYYAGIAKVIMGYTFMSLVDAWGDVPYDQFANVEFPQPTPDKSDYIYNQILTSLEEAVADFNVTDANKNARVPGTDDVIYRGDIQKWIKAANTLQLRMLLQSRKAKDQIDNWSGRLNALLAADNFIGDGEDFEMPHTATKAPRDERKWGFLSEYAGGQKTYFPSPWFYELLAGTTYNFEDNPFVGLVDPRIPYFFVNQTAADGDASNDTDYRDGGFISIMFNSNSGKDGGSQETSMTVLGVYPVGGRYDDGSTPTIDENEGSGIAPDKMIQAYSVPFMKAELILTEGIAGDAATELRNGMEASIFHINKVAQNSESKVPIPVLSTATTEVSDYIDDVIDLFNAADADGKLEIVMTQKWIANFYNCMEAYNDIRRTGYPRLFEGLTIGGELSFRTPYAHTKAATPTLTVSPLNSFRDFPRILPYTNDEMESNPNINNDARTDLGQKGYVFWDK